MRRLLKPLRLLLGLLVLAGFVAAFTDFRGLVPDAVARGLAALQFTPALLVLLAGGAAGLVLLGLLVLTLLFGRVYCSVLCPLGLLQDAGARVLRWRPGRRPLLPYAPEHRRWRYGILALVVVLAVLAGRNLAVAWSDPYSHFGRIFSGLVRPLVVAGNNRLVGWVPDPGGRLFRVPPAWPGPGLAVPAALTLLLVAGLAAWRGRLYCNTLCPVGTVLGLLSRYAAFRLEVDRAACTRCARCLRECKAQCLDLRAGVIDASRCVACYNCIPACPEHGIRHRFAWRRRPAPPPVPAGVPDPERRALLGGVLLLAPAALLRPAEPAGPAEAARPPVTPPGARGRTEFLDRCTACQLCVSACPTQVLQPAFLEYGPAGLARPRLDFRRAFCNFDCRRCGEVCPTGAIAPLALADKHVTSVGTARFEQKDCIVDRDGTDCAACSEHCPTKAVDTVPFRTNLRLPQVREELCIGCGACEYACPAQPRKAIVVTARDRHTRARPADTAPAARRPATTDFPF
jgi:ferredoxin